MNLKKITSLVILLVIVVIVIYDVFAIAKGGTEASISHTLQVWAYKYPAMTFSMGFVMGHLYWPISHTKELEDLKKKLKEDQ